MINILEKVDLKRGIDALYTMPRIIRRTIIFLCGALCSFALPPYGQLYAFIIGFGLFTLILSTVKSSRSAFFSGWLFGLGYFVFSLNWIGNALLVDGNEFWWVWPLAVIALPIALSFFTGLATLLADRFFHLGKISGFIALCAFMSFFEYLRGHLFTGFPWNIYGHIWINTLPMAQSLSVIGPYGLTFLTLLWTGAPAYIFYQKRSLNFIFGTVLFLGFVATFMLGWNRLNENPTQYRDDLNVQIVQPNIPQAEKWDNTLIAANFEKHTVLSAPQDDAPKKPTYIIWPETALGPNMVNSFAVKQRLQNLLQSHAEGSVLLTGTMSIGFDTDNTVQYYNNITAYNAQGQLQHLYNKSHLVPFGEYIPFQNLIPLKPVAEFSGFEKGSGPITTTVNGLSFFSPFICYEVIFPGKVTANSGQRPEWLLNVTNDAWYGLSAGPHQHFAQSRMRSIEEGLPLVRSASTGISGLIDPMGRVLAHHDLMTSGLIISNLPQSIPPTLYSIWREIPYFIVLGFIALFSIISRIKRPQLPK
ncbi:MAG: apolipoprotein N-acyltransferase [Alphaproteobacteria bacterium]|nr:apolipoprotein N-acyltransferase [Alphaproteobacteria bacterium]NCQ87926.1 apolipoprotein N-acyltransferase [Alphaproteobacteria bacterium]NCT05567.1 apolipoprotein N-acyltransferase [Alphaproteobacteria bacterium]